MNVENPAALRFIMQDDIFLLAADKAVTKPEVAKPQVQQTSASQPASTTQNGLIPSIQIPEKVTPEPEIAVVQADVAILPTQQTPPAQINYLGANKKQILILTHYINEPHIAAEHLTALESILKRKDIALDDVVIFNMAGKSVDMPLLKSQFKPIKLLVLGAAAMPQKMNLPFNQLKQGNGSAALYSFSFEEMMSSNDHKKAFWDQMKNF